MLDNKENNIYKLLSDLGDLVITLNSCKHKKAFATIKGLSDAEKSTMIDKLYKDTKGFSDGDEKLVIDDDRYQKREQNLHIVRLLIISGCSLEYRLCDENTLLGAIILLKKDNAYRRKFIEAILESPRLDGDIKKILGFVPCISTANDLESIAIHFAPPNRNSSLFCLSGVCNLFSGIMPGTSSGDVADSKRQDPEAKGQAKALLVKKNQ